MQLGGDRGVRGQHISRLQRRGIGALVLIFGAITLGACPAEIIIEQRDAGSTSGTEAGAGGGNASSSASSSGVGTSASSSGGGEAGGSVSSSSSASSSASSSTSSSASSSSSGSSGGPGPIGDVFDPGQVYLLGTIVPGSAGRDAMAHWSDPNTAAIGFIGAYDQSTARLRSDGTLMYVLAGAVREFVCDACPYVGNYPNGSNMNDPILPTAPCVPNDWLVDIMVGPDGLWVHSCSGDFNRHWYDPNGVLVYGDDQDLLVHLGYSNLALTQTRVVDLANSSSSPIVGLPNAPLLAVRAIAPDAFHVAIAAGMGDGAAELWRIDATGMATFVGAYPPVPVGYTVKPIFAHEYHALEPMGALLQFGQGPMTFQDVIVRREIDGASAVVYDEAMGPLVKIHISKFVTGP